MRILKSKGDVRYVSNFKANSYRRQGDSTTKQGHKICTAFTKDMVVKVTRARKTQEGGTWTELD